MLAPPTVPGLLAAAAALARRAETAAGRAVDEEPVLSLALPLQPGEAKRLDPLALLPALDGTDPFRFLWDGAPGLCLAASGRCHSLRPARVCGARGRCIVRTQPRLSLAPYLGEHLGQGRGYLRQLFGYAGRLQARLERAVDFVQSRWGEMPR